MKTLLLLFALLGLSCLMTAQETYTVAPGETLSFIAQKFYADPSKWNLIYEANKDTIGSDPNLILDGMILEIPQLSDTSQPASVPDSQQISSPSHYKIVEGDTLETIAQALYGNSSSWQVLYSANFHVIGDDPQQLVSGVMLAVPAPTNSSGVVSPPVSTITHYTTTDSDTLESIAQYFYGDSNKWEPIYQANSMEVSVEDPTSMIGAGVMLHIPAISDLTKNSPLVVPTHYKIVEGDTLESIAANLYGDSSRWQAIYAANFHRIGDDPNQVRAGTMLAIPAASF